MSKGIFRTLGLLVLTGALVFRVVGLERRPMHHDESNQAVKFGALLERGEYRYDRDDHHGPTLYYLSLPLAWVTAGRNFAAVDETVLRLVPALFGVGVVLLLLVLGHGLGRPAALAAALLAALSPAVVYFSRFYIQETLLVFFTAALIVSGWRYRLRPSAGWALAAGLAAGLMFATKETSVIILVALAGALALTALSMRRSHTGDRPPGFLNPRHVLMFAGVAAAVAFLLFSSFLRNLHGPLDSILAFSTYFRRAGEAGMHAHPWSYYLGMLSWFRVGAGPVWSEALVLILALVGAASSFRRKAEQEGRSELARFLLFYALLALTVFSLISYKTPWNLLPFYLGLLALAGRGAARLLSAGEGGRRPRWRVIAAALVLAVGVWHLGRQCWAANFRYPADPRNPYVYAHTSTDFLNLVRRVRDLASLHPEGRRMLIKVVTDPYETWPLPWYLRDFERVGYWSDPAAAGELKDVPLIVSSVGMLKDMTPFLEEGYQSEFYGLRPEVLLALHIRRDLWESFLRERRR